ncbi:MAG: cupin domain-containing protein [Alphaproteobacteria bacterium]
MTRPDFIRHWSEIEPKQPLQLPNSAEQFGFHTPYSRATGLSRLRVNHIRLAPGMRLSPPGAMRDEEEFVYVIEGAPDMWCDGYLYRLAEGEGAGFKDRTGIAHTFLNNTQSDVRLLVVAEASRYTTRLVHPFDQAQNQQLKRVGKLWEDVPARELGPHDGLADARRGTPAAEGSVAAGKPDYVAHWKDIQRPAWSYPGSIEKHGLHSKFGRHFGLGRIGVHHEVLVPGTRTSWPHAERDEEEFVFVLEGEPDCWIDGELNRLKPGDGAGFPDQTGICHVFINSTPKPVRLLVAGEASRVRSKVYYPLHPGRNQEIGEMFWADWPKRKIGPHDGMPDALRDRIAKGELKKIAAPKIAKPAAKPKAKNVKSR